MFLKCFNEIQKKLKRGEILSFSSIGKERVEFNAHRIFYAETVIENFPSLELKEFSCTAGGEMEYNPDIHQYDNDKTYGRLSLRVILFQEKIGDNYGYCKNLGGLGNQMFQYAFARALKEKGVDVRIDLKSL